MVTEGVSVRSRGYRLFRNAVVAVLASALLVGAVAIETRAFHPNQGNRQTGVVRLISNGAVVPGSSSFLTRTNDGADFTFKTSGIPAGHVVVLKAVIFNEPRNCKHGVGGVPCGDADLSNPDVKGSVVFVTGEWVRSAVSVDLPGHLAANDKSRALVGDGLTNPHLAEVHLVVVDHGPPIAALYNAMISTLGGGCKDAAPGSGTPGPNTCADIQISTHE